MHTPLTISLLCLFTLTCFAQEPVLLLRGKIVSSTTGEPIGYATIGLSRDGLSTISNEDGDFIFNIPSASAADSIYVSHIGFQTIGFALRTADTGINTIMLRERPVELPAVTVHRTDALAIIRKAIDRIPDNYPTRPYLLTGFYRETVTNEHRFTNLSEAVFDIFSPDNDRKNMELRLIKVRAIRDISAYKGLNATFGKRPARLMDFDLVSRAHSSPFLSQEGQNDHIFTLGGLIDYEGKPSWEIGFDQKDDVQRSLYKGRIIIDTASLAFLCFDYRLSPKGVSYRRPAEKGLHALMSGQSTVVQYRRYGGKYYFHHAYAADSIVVHYQEKNVALDFDPIVAGVNYLITRIDTGSAAFKKSGTLADNETLLESHTRENTRRRSNYWENYNYIEAGFNIDSALNAIQKNNDAFTRP